MHVKRYLYLWHRWLGIALCLFMALWFVSGIVMLYVGYPKLTAAEHLARLPALPVSDCCIEPAQALAASGRSDAPQSLRLSSVAGSPRYLLRFADGTQVAVDGRSGLRIEAVTAEQALASARQFEATAKADYQGLVQEDRWTLSRALDADRPLHRVQLDDAQRHLLYVSSRTGAVVRDAPATERAWNWLGAWLHWLYPLRGPWWTTLVIYLSVAATLMAVLGQVVGLLRWRFARPYRSGSRSPYAGFARWHHLVGLWFGVALIAWMFSGLMSMNPWRLFESPASLSEAAYRGGELRAENALPLAEALGRFRQAGLQPHELEWRQIGGEGYLAAYDSAGRSRILAMRATAEPQPRLDRQTLHAAAQAMWPDGRSTAEWLHAYDAYYFARAGQSMYGGQPRPLPVLRVRFDDPARTWVYLDPFSGALIHRLDEHRRAARWLFNLLHSWDWQPLLERPWLREGLVIVFSLGGIVVSLSGVVLGWRRLRRPAGRRVVRNA